MMTTLRRVFLLLASVALGVVLVYLLIRIGKIDLRLTLLQLESVRRVTFVKLVLLNGLLVYLSTAKWRSIDAVLRRPSDSVPSRITSFAVTSAGMALGLILPVQVGMTAARTLGTYFYGRPLKRGTVGTLFEQSFDLLIVLFLSVSSGVTWFYSGGAVMWMASAAAMTALALLLVAPLIGLIRWAGASYSARTAAPRNRILRSFWELQHSSLLNAALARRLVMLSAVRFGVVVLMAGQTVEAIHAHIPLWHMAAAVPFVVIVTVIAVTPGGIGVNELTLATALKVFGTPLTVAAQWTLANRVLGTASCFAVAACAAIVWAVEKMTTSRTGDANGKTRAEVQGNV
jgi:uncharacterized membrane protein YbhN (UPF0104 family)